MGVLWLGLIGAILGVMLLLARLVARPPRCPECWIPAVYATDSLLHANPSVLEITYRCPSCCRVLSRRVVGDLSA